jgi:ribose transport system permease protein
MRKIIALAILIAVLMLITYWINPNFATAFNISNLARKSALLSIYAIGVGVVIIAGGIDLSLGALVALTGYVSAMLIADKGYHPAAVIPLILLIGVAVGLLHGVLVAYANLQPFVVTLCGLLAYRGLARVISGDASGGISDQYAFVRSLTSGTVLGVPMPVWFVLFLGIIAYLFLSRTIWGTYIYAIGNNEQAALYSGINVKFTKILTFVICSVLGAFSGLLEVSEVGSITPAGTGTFYELYAIAAAVLGGCSLRGGEGTVLGIILGAVAIRLITNVTNMLGIPSQWEYVVLGSVILAGALVDAAIEKYRANQR